MKHTPLPWRVNRKVPASVETVKDGQGINLIAHCEDCDGERTRTEDQANAAYIVQACNAYPELVEALESLYALHTGEHSQDDYQSAQLKALDKAEAALKKAGG